MLVIHSYISKCYFNELSQEGRVEFAPGTVDDLRLNLYQEISQLLFLWFLDSMGCIIHAFHLHCIHPRCCVACELLLPKGESQGKPQPPPSVLPQPEDGGVWRRSANMPPVPPLPVFAFWT